MIYNLDNIQTFLHYGYIPDPEVPLPDSLKNWFFGRLLSSDYSNMPKSELIKIGAETLKISFKEEIGNDYDKIHIIPLSGGLDSRTVLANLLEYIDPSKIITITFGEPGSPDYERAKSIAKKAGVLWECIDLLPGKWKWSTDLLIETAKRSERPTRIFDTAVNHSIQLKFGKNYVYWSGFMGDSLGRINPVSVRNKTWKDAKTAFVRNNCTCVKYKLPIPDFNPDICLPDKPFTDSNNLDYYSQLNFRIRQLCLTKHIYSPRGYDIRYPFLNTKWVEFILSVPRHYRHRQILYRKILGSAWPNLFNKWNSTPRDSTKLEDLIYESPKNLLRKIIKKVFPSLTQKTPDKDINYIDWNYALRYQEDFKYVVYSNLQDLIARKIIFWLDIEKIWTSHQNIKKDLAKELMTLAALEIHIKAKTIN